MPTSNEPQTPPCIELKHQISDTLKWINGRAWPLAGILLAIPGLYLFNFITQEKVPLSITSPSLIGTLAVLLATLTLFIGLLILFFSLPAAVLITPIRNNKQTRPADFLPIKKKRLRIGRRLCFVWLLIPILFGLAFSVAPWIHQKNLNKLDLSEFFLWLTIITLLALLFIRKLIRPSRIKNVSTKFKAYAAIAIAFQFVIILYATLITGNITPPSDQSPLKFIAGVLFFSISIGLGQLVMTRLFITLSRSDRVLQKTALVSLVIVVLLGLYPPTATFLTGAVMRFASGGRVCAVLSWTDASPKSLQPLHGGTDTSSKPLRILMETDGNYIVRLDKKEEKHKTYFVPRTLVAGIEDCPR